MKKKGIIAIISAAVVVFVLIIAIVGGVALLPLAKLFSKEKLSISDIQAMASEGSIDIAYQNNGTIRLIDGTFTDVVVDSKKDAAKVLQMSSLLLGETFSATEDCISDQTAEDSLDSAEHFYRYSPIVNGIPVVGSQVVLSTNKDGKVTGLFSTYNDSIYNVNTEPDISEEEVLDKAWEALLSDEEIDTFLDQYVSDDLPKSAVIAEFKARMATNVKLQIDGSTALLVYSVTVYSKVDSPATIDDDGNNVYTDSPINIESANDPERVNADFSMIDITYSFLASGDNAGELIQVSNNIQGWDTVQLTAKDQRGNTRVFYAQTKDGKFRLRDAARNLETYKTTYGNILWVEPKLPGKMVEFTTTMSSVAVSAHANMSTVYDYYLNVLGRKSFDGNGKKVISSYDYDNCQFIFTGNYKNASWKSSAQQFVFGDEGNYASALDVVAHEFTHAVINYIVGDGYDVSLTYEGESGALNEAYADIMGCLIEGKTGEGLWLCGEDADEAIRSMKDPSAYDQPEHYKDRYTGGNDHGGVHTNSGIFNHAAYKMITDKRTSGIELTTWAKVFYRSLFRLTTDATFADARGAIISAAKNIGFSSEQINAIKDAFDAVGIRSGTNESAVPDTETSTPTENNESSPNSVDDNDTSSNEPSNNTSKPENNTSVPSIELNVGDHIYFGSAKPGEDPDIWQVINIDGNYVLLYNMYMYKGVFDATIHAETTVISLMRYHSYGSATWEYSDVRSWLNSRDTTVAYQDIQFDYSAEGFVTLPHPSEKTPSYVDSEGYLNRFTELEYSIIQPVTHQSLIPYTESGMNSVFDTEVKDFTIDLSQFYEEPYGTSETTDFMFLLNGWEFKEYVLDNNLWGYQYPNGNNLATFWLRDSVNTDFAGFYGYYGTHMLTAGSNKAGSNQADLEAAIRPACYIDIRYIANMVGTGSFEDPYKLTIDSSVVNREIDEFSVSVNIADSEDNELDLESSNGLLITEHGDHCSVDGIGTCTLSNLIIPSEYNGLPVTIISDKAFLECTNLTSVTIPDSVTTIGDSAFSECENLAHVTMGDNVTTIGQDAFYETAITNISLPDSVERIESLAFACCWEMVDATITIPKSIKSLDYYAFAVTCAFIDIRYDGTMAEWEAIVVGDDGGLYSFTSGQLYVYCTDGIYRHDYYSITSP